MTNSKLNNPDKYDVKYMKIKLNLDDDLPLKKKLKLYNMKVVVGYVFHEGSKCYKEVFLDEYFYKLAE